MWVRQVQAGLPARSLLHPSDPANAVEADSNPWPTAAVSPFVQGVPPARRKGYVREGLSRDNVRAGLSRGEWRC